MDANQLARRIVENLKTAAAITEPLLIIDGQTYTAGQLKALLDAGELARADGHEAVPPDASLYTLAEQYPRVSAAQQFLACLERNNKQLYIAAHTTDNSGAKLPTIEIAAPPDYTAAMINIVYTSASE